jgi:3-methylcrotonyl-CoA carboxylase alpha subunit
VFIVEWQDRAWRVTVAADAIVVQEANGDEAAPRTRVELASPARGGEVVLRIGDRVHRLFAAAHGDTRWVFHDGRVFEFTVERASPGTRRRSPHQHGPLTAPMPATVIGVRVKPGDRVSRGQTVVVLEAMKMELPLRASGDGVVRAVHCREGELVQPGASLVDVE